MNAEILCIGTELVLGDIVNTNAQFLSSRLADLGINVYYQSAVGDNKERIVESLKTAISRSNLIIFTGGMGPTADDITLSVVAGALGIELERDEKAYTDIVEYFKKLGKPLTDNNEKQAFLPKGSIPFYNTIGTAPGCAIESGSQRIIFLPGPPKEVKAMFETSVEPYLKKFTNSIIKSRFVHIYGIGESKIDEMAADLIAGENPTVAPYAKDGEAYLRVTAKAATELSASTLVSATIRRLQKIFGEYIYGYDDDELQDALVRLLKEKEFTVATAESCTAGYISKRITDVPGASSVFKMGEITYSNESKTLLLDVPEKLIADHGAVSPEVAACMAKGIRVKSGATFGLAISGIAGPDSDGTDKPVGLSYIAISDKTGEYVLESMKTARNDREYVRYTSSSEALNFLRLFIIDRAQQLLGKVKKYKAVLLSETNRRNRKPLEETGASLKAFSSPMSVTIAPEVLEQLKQANEKLETEEAESSRFDRVELKEMPKRKLKKDKTQQLKNVVSINENAYSEVDDDEFKELDDILFQHEKELVEREKNKERSKRTKVGKTLGIIAAAVAFVVSLTYVAGYFLLPIYHNGVLNSLSDEYKNTSYPSDDYYSDKINPKFEEIYVKNSDFIGWIEIPGTSISYPVLKPKENGYYLRRGFTRFYSREGSIFTDKETSIRYKNESKNITLYGHHMDSTKTMFYELDKYQNLQFYKKNSVIEFDTIFRDSDYQVFAVFITNSIPEQDNGNYFNYTKTEFESDQEFLAFIEEAKVRSLITNDVLVEADDEILTLQTCNNSFGNDDDDKARLVVMAKRLDNDEKPQNVSLAKKAKEPKYPQIWYDIKQKVNPYADNIADAAATEKVTEETSATSTSATSSTTTVTSTTKTTAKTTVKTTAKTTVKTAATTTQKMSEKTTAKKTTTKATTTKPKKTTTTTTTTTSAQAQENE